jgi:hypothetical protein
MRCVCRSCGRKWDEYRTNVKGFYCSKRCRADHERKGRDAPKRYIQDGYWMLCWNVGGGTKRRPNRAFQFEHRRVWEDANGPIPPGHVIHHINEVRTDNRLENLQLMRIGDHISHHHKGKPKRKMA